MDPQHLRHVYERADLLYPEEVVEATITRLGNDISAHLSDCFPVVYCIMTGALIFTGKLLPQLRFPLDLQYLHATRYRAAQRGGAIEWRVAPAAAIEGREVLLLDDILDEGHTLLAIIDALLAQGARQVHTAVLADKIHDRKARKDLKADFTGLEVPDRYVFGYGMDYQGYWRNAPGIYALAAEDDESQP